MNTFHLFHTKMDHYREMIKIDKTEAKLWAKRYWTQQKIFFYTEEDNEIRNDLF